MDLSTIIRNKNLVSLEEWIVQHCSDEEEQRIAKLGRANNQTAMEVGTFGKNFRTMDTGFLDASYKHGNLATLDGH